MKRNHYLFKELIDMIFIYDECRKNQKLHFTLKDFRTDDIQITVFIIIFIND